MTRTERDIVRTALFVCWPLIAVCVVAVVAVFVVLVWPLVPFCKITEKE
jgi:hypothetical protein